MKETYFSTKLCLLVIEINNVIYTNVSCAVCIDIDLLCRSSCFLILILYLRKHLLDKGIIMN
jgi:hypothetical protein